MTSETTTQIELQILELESKAQKKKDRFEKEYAKLTKQIEELREQVVPKLPPELEGHFGPFTQVLGSDDVPTAWGYRPRGHLPEDAPDTVPISRPDAKSQRPTDTQQQPEVLRKRA